MFRMVSSTGGAPALEVARRGLLLPHVRVQPLTWGETGPVRQVFDGMSPHSRRMRFLAAVPYLHPAVLHRLAYADHDRHGCWVATMAGEPVGIGRYFRTAADPAVAEVAFEVVDACQGLGLGRLLLDVVAVAAADVGATSLLWLMDETNERVQRLAGALGGGFVSEYGMLEGTTPLPAVGGADAALIAQCARLARAHATEQAAA